MAHDVKDFQQEVVQRSNQIPVLVDFWAEWCGPCRVLGPVLERLAEQHRGEWELAKVNTEELTEIAMAYRIQSIPSVKLFSEGKVIGEFVGALPEHMIKQWLDKFLPGKHQKSLDVANSLLTENKIAEAQSVLDEILENDPENVDAKALLAKTLVLEKPEKASELIKNIDEPRLSDSTDTVATFLRLLALEQAPDQLPETEGKSSYLKAISHLRQQQFAQALALFVEVIRENRYYDDDGSRKACIAIFKYLGEEHPVTLEFRKEFSRALY